MHRLQRLARTQRFKNLRLVSKKTGFSIDIFTKKDIFNFLSIILLIVFMCIYLSCEGWSVMGYALDESQKDIKIENKEIDE